MFFIDFLNNVYFTEYIIALFSILIFLWFINIKNGLQLIEPINMLDLVFLQTSLLLVFHKEGVFFNTGIIFTCFYIFLRWRFLKLKISFIIKKVPIPIKLITYLNCAYMIVAIFIFIKFYSVHKAPAFKLTWNQNHKALGFIYSFLSTIALYNIIYIVKFGATKTYKYILIGATLTIFLYSGVYFHSKGAFVSLIFLLLIYAKVFDKKIKLKQSLLMLAIIPFGVLIGFGGDYLLFFNRLLKNTDGTFIILEENLYQFDLFTNSFWVQIFKVVSHNIGFPKQETGETIASFSKYSYPEHGGPNDNVFNYLLLNFNIVSIVIYMVLAILLITFLHKNFKTIFNNFYLYHLAIFFYIKSSALLQAPSTFFLYLAKYLVFFIIIIGTFLILPKKIKQL
jgi:hypothetical protein